MVSLKSFWRSGQPTSTEYIRALKALIDSIGSEAVDRDLDGITQFREELSAIAATLNEDSSNEELQATLVAAVERLRAFNLGSAKRGQSRIDELRTVMRAMTDTITFLSESRSTVVHQLNYLERQLEQATDLEDIRLLRPRLMSCLEVVRQETARLKAESTQHSQRVATQMSPAAKAVPVEIRLGAMDPVTGLPDRHSAQRMIAEHASSNFGLAVFVPTTVAAINRRHGRNAGDEILLAIAQHLIRHFPPNVFICRWSGPAFLVLLELKGGYREFDQSCSKFLSKQWETTVVSDRGSVSVRIAHACLTKQLPYTGDIQQLINDLDGFVADAVGEEP